MYRRIFQVKSREKTGKLRKTGLNNWSISKSKKGKAQGALKGERSLHKCHKCGINTCIFFIALS